MKEGGNRRVADGGEETGEESEKMEKGVVGGVEGCNINPLMFHPDLRAVSQSVCKGRFSTNQRSLFPKNVNT